MSIFSEECSWPQTVSKKTSSDGCSVRVAQTLQTKCEGLIVWANEQEAGEADSEWANLLPSWSRGRMPD